MRATLFALSLTSLSSVSTAAVASDSWYSSKAWPYSWPEASGQWATASSGSSSTATSEVAIAMASTLSSASSATHSTSASTTASATGSGPTATPSVTHNAPSEQCLSRLDDTLPAYLPPGYTFSGNIRRFYVSAEQTTWNYMPTGWDNWLGVPVEDSPHVYQAGYTKAAGALGYVWEKAVYRGYTDATFSQESERPDWQGINGPTLRAEVGDMIEILFVNNLKEHYASIHSMGLSYNKDNEGSLYPNNTSAGMESGSQSSDLYSTPNTTQSVGNAVPPGGCYTYKWVVANTSAPTNGAVSKMWSYHPFVSMPSDMNAGLVGPVIIYKPGYMDATMASTREFVLLYMNFNEANSWLAEFNANAYGLTNLTRPGGPFPMQNQGYGNYSVWHPQITNMPSVVLSATQAPSFHSLNGYSYANVPRFEMCVDDPVIWYVYAFGAASHVFHLHGNNFVYDGEEHASLSFNDGVMRALTMNAASRGSWQLVCHVSNHLTNGMEANYLVVPNDGPNGTCGLPPLAAPSLPGLGHL